jgi:hypothetical protein
MNNELKHPLLRTVLYNNMPFHLPFFDTTNTLPEQRKRAARWNVFGVCCLMGGIVLLTFASTTKHDEDPTIAASNNNNSANKHRNAYERQHSHHDPRLINPPPPPVKLDSGANETLTVPHKNITKPNFGTYTLPIPMHVNKTTAPPRKDPSKAPSSSNNTSNSTAKLLPTTWPGLVGTHATFAARIIHLENPTVKVEIVPNDNFVSADYVALRVRVFTFPNNDTVVSVPQIG